MSTLDKNLTKEQQRNKELIERYPYLLPRDAWTGEVIEDYDYTWIEDCELPYGWRRLFLQMCEDIRQPLIDADYLDKFRFSQVKEKYNRMECYTLGAPEAVHDIISKYTMMACYVCSRCGKPATFETDGYVASYCDDCWQDFAKQWKGRWLNFKPYYTVCGFSKDGSWREKTISFEDEWNRYLKSIGD